MSLEACRNVLQYFIGKSPVVDPLQNSVALYKDGRLSSIRVAVGTPCKFQRFFSTTASALEDTSLTNFTGQKKNALAQTLKDSYDDSVGERLKYWIVPVATPEEALAAATLRAGVFFRYAEAGCQTSRKLPFLYRSQDQLNAQIRSEYNRVNTQITQCCYRLFKRRHMAGNGFAFVPSVHSMKKSVQMLQMQGISLPRGILIPDSVQTRTQSLHEITSCYIC